MLGAGFLLGEQSSLGNSFDNACFAVARPEP